MARSHPPRVLGPEDGTAGRLGSIGVRFMLDGDETGRILELIPRLTEKYGPTFGPPPANEVEP